VLKNDPRYQAPQLDAGPTASEAAAHN
jgi:hypothetical protein